MKEERKKPEQILKMKETEDQKSPLTNLKLSCVFKIVLVSTYAIFNINELAGLLLLIKLTEIYFFKLNNQLLYFIAPELWKML